MLFTEEQIRFLMKEMSYETVHEPTDDYPYRVQRLERAGYSSDLNRGQIQAALSIMLEVKTTKSTVASRD